MSHTIHTEIVIDAPVSVVWDVLTELAHYRDWNPFILDAEGSIAMGEVLELKPRLPGSRRQLHFQAVVTTCETGVIFAWTGYMLSPWLSAGEHIFRLVALSEQKTRLHHDEVFSGLLAPLGMLVAGRRTRDGFVLMNEATKRAAEERFGRLM